MPKVRLATDPSKKAVDRAGEFAASIFERWRTAPSTDPLEGVTEDVEMDFVESLLLIEWWRQQHAYPMLMVAAGLRYYTRPYVAVGGLKPVTQRLKKEVTILDKLIRLPTMGLTQMGDIGGVRVVLPDQDAVDDVLRRVRKNWRDEIERVRDYVASPKDSGYRAKHLIVVKKTRRIEVQLRTPLQDTWANQVEADSRWAPNFKAGAGHQAVHDYYVLVSKLFASREAGVEPDGEFMQDLVVRYREARPYLPGHHDHER